MPTYQFNCNNLPYGDLFVKAQNATKARLDFIAYISNSVDFNEISEEVYPELKEGKVLEEH